MIGGGDWAPYRIVPDCFRSWSKNETLEIRSPFATRPWQHVLEPLSGYLTLASKLSKDMSLNGESFNFGPPAHQNHTVKQLIDEIANYWDGAEWLDKSKGNFSLPEAGLLKLNCDKALHLLKWQATLNFEETAKWTGEWYRIFYKNNPETAFEQTFDQIKDYFSIAKERDTFKID